MDTFKFESVSCSQCGQAFGPGDCGYSHCIDHRPKPAPNVSVRVEGGIAQWDGSRWLSVTDGMRPIQWKVTWWEPIVDLKTIIANVIESHLDDWDSESRFAPQRDRMAEAILEAIEQELF